MAEALEGRPCNPPAPLIFGGQGPFKIAKTFTQSAQLRVLARKVAWVRIQQLPGTGVAHHLMRAVPRHHFRLTVPERQKGLVTAIHRIHQHGQMVENGEQRYRGPLVHLPWQGLLILRELDEEAVVIQHTIRPRQRGQVVRRTALTKTGICLVHRENAVGLSRQKTLPRLVRGLH